jgi:hypothetical protein
MPRCKAFKCFPPVKEAFYTIHASCSKAVHKSSGTTRTGLFKNKFSPVVQFEEEELYHVCYNMDSTLFKRKRVNECISVIEKPVPLPPELVLLVVETREDRR